MPNLRPTVQAALSQRVGFARTAANPESSGHCNEILELAGKYGVRKRGCLILRVIGPSACGNLQDATTLQRLLDLSPEGQVKMIGRVGQSTDRVSLLPGDFIAAVAVLRLPVVSTRLPGPRQHGWYNQREAG